jgi:hypothetical protein
MGSAFAGVDIVYKRIHYFVKTVVVLDSAFHFNIVTRAIVAGTFNVNWLLVQHGFVLVKIFNKTFYTAVKLKFVNFWSGKPFVPNSDLKTLVKKGQLSKTVA